MCLKNILNTVVLYGISMFPFQDYKLVVEWSYLIEITDDQFL